MTISLALKSTRSIQTVHNIISQYIKAGYNTANLCAIDLKAFDKINIHALFIKLMKIPNKLLIVFENWLCGSYAGVK